MGPAQIVLDTNILVSALRSRRGASFRLLSLLGSGRFEINLSVPLLFEYEDVLTRLQGDLRLSGQDIDDLLNYICSIANHHEVYFLWRPTLKDPKDEMVLELAVTAGCRHIVTYNKRDFAGVERFGIEVIDAKEFLKTIGEII